MFEGVEGLATRALGESGVEKFNDTTGATYALDIGVPVGGGETLPAIMDEVGLDIPSPELDIPKIKGTPNSNKPKG